MSAPQLKQKDPKTLERNKRKPTAQEMNQQVANKQTPAVNPTNAADHTNCDTTLNHAAGYSTQDSPGEGEDNTTDSLKQDPTRADGGDKEIAAPAETPNPVEDTPLKMDGDYPTENNPRM